MGEKSVPVPGATAVATNSRLYNAVMRKIDNIE